MATSERTVHRGIVHGKTIELDETLDMPDGQAVLVTLLPAQACESAEADELHKVAFGSWTGDDEELKSFLEWNRRMRSLDRPELDP